MFTKPYRLMVLLILTLSFFLTTTVSAQDKVVVIPLMEEAPPPAPYAPLAADSPSASDYNVYSLWGHVNDEVTGLIWQREDDNNPRNWDAAWDYCQDLELPSGGWTDWRLPSADELMSIVDYGTDSPAINGSAFPGTNPSWYWSATTFADYSVNAWVVDFTYGEVYYYGKSDTHYVRCVR